MIEVDDTSTRKEIEKEVEILKKCKTNHVVSYYGTVVNEDKLWILMEFCEAGSIKDIMHVAQTSLEEDQIAYIFRQALIGLDYLHQKRIIHRDIKAANILMNFEGNIKIADFGVSTNMDTLHNTANRTANGGLGLVGTPFWMAPEVLGQRQYDFPADIWAIGITAIEIADGIPPFSDMHPLRAMMMIPHLVRKTKLIYMADAC
jgi:serine/threonine kinase 3